MEKQNLDLEQQVWQRVRAGRQEESGNDLRQLRREAMELAAIYRQLSIQLPAGQREIAAKLHRGENATAAALAGIGILSGNPEESLKRWQPGKEDPARQLIRCYHRTRRCMTEYLARSAEAEYGLVFEKLAKRAAEHCSLIAEMLGVTG